MSTTEMKDGVRDIKEVVKQKYGEAALRVKSGGSSCCGAFSGGGCGDPITSNLYDALEATQIPEEALLARSWLRRRHRRTAQREACRAHRQSVRA